MADRADLQNIRNDELVEELIRRELIECVVDRAPDHLLVSEIFERDLEHRFADPDRTEIDDMALEDARFRLSLGDLGEAAIQIARVHPDLARLPDLITRSLNGEA